MRRTLLVMLLCTAALVASQVSSAAPGAPVAFVVARVADGDTLSLTSGARVRLVQIDAPEVGSHECWAEASRRELLRLTPVGSSVVLETDPALDRVDRHGRLLRYVVRSGVNVNLELVRRGAAAPYFYGGDRGRYATRLLLAANAARRAGRGLWGARPQTALDPYRQIDTGRCDSAETRPQPLVPQPAPGDCDPSYAGACVPPSPPDLDCADLRELGLSLPLRVVGEDPHRLDGDRDGVGCETG